MPPIDEEVRAQHNKVRVLSGRKGHTRNESNGRNCKHANKVEAPIPRVKFSVTQVKMRKYVISPSKVDSAAVLHLEGNIEEHTGPFLAILWDRCILRMAGIERPAQLHDTTIGQLGRQELNEL